ncbi:MAG: formylglycine-generating enzyme family protein, partial [Pseudomonadota bacterium]|nr:formylglycine-generating enzyme family protein [Pseudomonadota bacterium]
MRASNHIRLTSILSLAAALLVTFSGTGDAGAATYVPLASSAFRSALQPDGQAAATAVMPVMMRSTLVSNVEFRDFLVTHAAWRRDLVPSIFAGADYLSQWSGARDFSPLAAMAPVTQVSWFAARAFCASEQARLPHWIEWELAAASDAQRADARDDPLWLAQILSWYATPASTPPASIGQQAPNFYGVRDLHGLVWEWVEDFNGLLINADSREQGSPAQREFCGGAALSLG